MRVDVCEHKVKTYSLLIEKEMIQLSFWVSAFPPWDLFICLVRKVYFRWKWQQEVTNTNLLQCQSSALNKARLFNEEKPTSGESDNRKLESINTHLLHCQSSALNKPRLFSAAAFPISCPSFFFFGESPLSVNNSKQNEETTWKRKYWNTDNTKQG